MDNKIDIFGSFDVEINAGKYFIHLFKEVCYSYTSYVNINLEYFLNSLTEKYGLNDENFLIKDEQSKTKKLSSIDYTSSAYLIKLKDKFLVEINSFKISFLYTKIIPVSEIHEVLEMIQKAKKKKKHKRKFYMITASNRGEHGFLFKKFNIKKVEVNIQAHYNDDFIEVDETITKFLKSDNKNGLVLLHGKHGTGKTTYIRSLMSEVNKRFIFLPSDMMEAISSPSFIPFISKYKNSVLVLEDAENLLSPRGSNFNSKNSLVNLLNLGDGLLSDALSLKIICTFNADIKQIDKAILRKGRLIARYEFKELELEKTIELCKEIKTNIVPTKPMTLADIFNDEKDYSGSSNEKTVGF